MPRSPQILAFSGVLRSEAGRSGSVGLVEHALSLVPGARDRARRLCYVPTAVGDATEAIEVQRDRVGSISRTEFGVLRLFPQPSVSDLRGYLLSQDVILVEGGSVVNLLAVWRAHGLPPILRECWQSGVVLAGASAGSLCWHVGGPTDSFGDWLDPFTDGLGFLPYSNGVHDDFADQPRRDTYRGLVATGALPAGYATEDGVGLHYVGTRLHEAVSIRSGARAWWVEPTRAGGWTETAVEPRQI